MIVHYGPYDLARRRPFPDGSIRYASCSARARRTRRGSGSRRPSQHAADATAPVLLIHGTADSVVSYRESERMHAALRAAGKASELLLLEGAPHAFQVDWRGEANRRANATMDAFLDRRPASADGVSHGRAGPLSRDRGPLRARAARRARRHLRPPVAAHARARARTRTSSRAATARASGTSTATSTSTSCARTGRSSSATTIRGRRGGAPPGGRRATASTAPGACGSSWRSTWSRSRRGPTGRSSPRTAPTSAPGRREVARAATAAGRCSRPRAPTTARMPGARRFPTA